MSCGVGCRCDSDLVLLCLWCRPAAAARTQPLAWELPHAVGVALRSHKQTILFYYQNKLLLIKIAQLEISYIFNQNNTCSNCSNLRKSNVAKIHGIIQIQNEGLE